MKVVHLLWSLEFGGIERLVLDLADVQREQGLDVAVLAGRARGRMAPLFAKAGIPVLDAGLRSGFDLGLSRREAIGACLAKADIVHVHSFNPALARFAKRARRPIVYTEHGNFGFGRRGTVRDRIKRSMLRRFLRNHVLHVTWNSRFTRDVARRLYGEPAAGTVILNGVRLDRIAEDASGAAVAFSWKSERRFVVATVSRLAGFKRIDRLIRAFARAFKRGEAGLAIVGDGPLRPELEVLARDLGVSEDVLFTGYRENPGDFMASADVCVFPSAGEPFGIVAVEALALGRPVVVMRDGGGLVEIIEPLSPEDVVADEQDLARRLVEYRAAWESGTLQEPAQVERRRARARDFDIRAMADTFAGIYAACL